MNDKKIEELLQGSAQKIQTKEFAAVWENISKKQHTSKPIANKRGSLSFWIAAATATLTACVVLAVVLTGLTPPPSHNQITDNDLLFDWEELGTPPASIDQIPDLPIEELPDVDLEGPTEPIQLPVVDFTRYDQINHTPFFSENGNCVVGGLIELSDNYDNPSFYLTVNYYSQELSVELPDKEYAQSCVINGAQVSYSIKEVYPSEGLYVFDIKASYKNVEYFMEYTSLNSSPEGFLNEFFTAIN